MKLTDITVEDLNRIAEEYGPAAFAEPFIIPTEEAKHIEYALRQAGALAVAMQRYEAASNVTGALAFGVALGLRLGQGARRA